MSPRKENEKKFSENVWGRYVEVMLECWKRNVAIYLQRIINSLPIFKKHTLAIRSVPYTLARLLQHSGPFENPSAPYGHS